MTYCLEGSCSIRLSYRGILAEKRCKDKKKNQEKRARNQEPKARNQEKIFIRKLREMIPKVGSQEIGKGTR
jgi:hypothetical protein